jgi:hypothetical protein
MSEHIQFDFLYDNHFSELKEAELLENRINLATLAEPYIGKYFSQDYIRRKIIRQTDQDILEQDKLIEQEINDGIIADPMELEMSMDGLGETQAGMGPTDVTGNGGVDPNLGVGLSEPAAPDKMKKVKPSGGDI